MFVTPAFQAPTEESAPPIEAARMLVDRVAPGDTAEARDLIAAALPEAETLGMAREVVCLERLQARLA